MVRTARVLAAAALADKTIVLTGAMVPYAFGSSDGLFNLGSALSFVQALPPGVYLAMNGQHFPWDAVRNNLATGIFESVDAYEPRRSLQSKLPSVGTTIFTVMSRLAADLGAINLSQGFPDFDCDPDWSTRSHGTCAPDVINTHRCRGSRALREAIAAKYQDFHGRRYDPGNRSDRHVGRHRGHLRRRRRSASSGRRSHRSRAVLRLVPSGDRVERRRPGHRAAARIRNTPSTGRRCALQ